MTPMPLRALRDMTDPLTFANHPLRNQPWEDTAMPTEQSREQVSQASDVHWRPTRRHVVVNADRIASHAAVTRVSAPRPHPVDWLGIVALVCGVVTVGAVVVMVLLAVGRR